ncbi:MAG: hypothetical protein K2X34_11930 [Hyphomonadaceae bacterium]|nr:hypothetical protein [Hyphomonadaceae bacterium]
MRLIIALALVASAFAPKAFAQSLDRGASTQSFVNACIASPHLAGRSTPEPTCACAAGVMSGQMTDRQYVMMGRLTPYTGNDAGMRGEIQRMASEGYTGEEIMEVGQMMIDSESLINSTCSIIDR